LETRRKERIDRGIKVRSEGIYVVSSLKEMLYVAGPRLFLIVGLLLLPLVLEMAPYWKRVVNIMCVYGLLAISGLSVSGEPCLSG
jgi:branched-chain amino acid transport system permease protein